MYVHALDIQDLRIHRELSLSFDASVIALTGPNGVGKTSILEALSLLCTLKSFRDGPTSSLIRNGSEKAQILSRVEILGVPRELVFQISKGTRSLLIDGKHPRKMNQYFSTMKCVSFSPDDLLTIKGEPQRRRDFIDRACFTLDPTHLNRIRNFQSILRQRNAALKQGVSDEQLDAWTPGFVDAAQQVRLHRENLRAFLTPKARDVHQYLTDNKGPDLSLVLELAGGEELYEALEMRRPLERQRRSTLVGPHRDQLVPMLGELDLRRQGSQGQARSVILSLKIALIELVFERTGQAPLLLLDDVSGELDHQRFERLLHRIREIRCQTFITTTRPEQLTDEISILHIG